MERAADNRRLFTGILLAVLLLQGEAMSAASEDLVTTYERAASVSPILGRAGALLRADRAGEPLARSALLPKVGLAGGVSGNSADISGFGKDFLGNTNLPGFAGEVNKDYLGASTSVTLTQPILDGQAWVALRSAKSQVRAGEAAMAAAEQDLMLRVSQAYFGVLQTQSDLRVAHTQRALLREILNQAEASLKAGSGDIIDVREARARVDAAESLLVGAESAVEVARQRLQRFTHSPCGELADLGALIPEGPHPDQAGPWIEMALETQPALTQAREQLQVAKDGVEAASRMRWPRVNLGVGYSYQKGGFLPSIESNQGQVGVNVSVPIFTSGEIEARVRRAEAQAAASRHQVSDVEDQVRLNTHTSFLVLKDSVAKCRAASSALESSRTSLDATRAGFEIGTRTIVDVLNGIRDATNAEADYHASLYNHVMARIDLKAAAGVLSTRDLEAINALLLAGPGQAPPERAAGK